MIPTLQELIAINPSERWLQEIFAVRIRFARGGVIQVTFDTQLDAENQTLLTDQDVFQNWGEVIAYNVEKDPPNNMEAICEEIADVFSERIETITRLVRWHVAQASVILVYLASGFYIEAGLSAERLCDDLISLDETKSTKIWGEWLNNVGNFLKEHIEIEFDENTSDRF